jgi:hypothetical protein
VRRRIRMPKKKYFETPGYLHIVGNPDKCTIDVFVGQTAEYKGLKRTDSYTLQELPDLYKKVEELVQNNKVNRPRIYASTLQDILQDSSETMKIEAAITKIFKSKWRKEDKNLWDYLEDEAKKDNHRRMHGEETRKIEIVDHYLIIRQYLKKQGLYFPDSHSSGSKVGGKNGSDT